MNAGFTPLLASCGNEPWWLAVCRRVFADYEARHPNTRAAAESDFRAEFPIDRQTSGMESRIGAMKFDDEQDGRGGHEVSGIVIDCSDKKFDDYQAAERADGAAMRVLVVQLQICLTVGY